MKKEIAELWVAALRSGKYEQGRSKLRRDDRFCCLGVLCDLAPQECGQWDPSYKANFESDGVSHSACLPHGVRVWADMASELGDFQSEHAPALSTLNDSGKTFAEIADIIEAHWEEL